MFTNPTSLWPIFKRQQGMISTLTTWGHPWASPWGLGVGQCRWRGTPPSGTCTSPFYMNEEVGWGNSSHPRSWLTPGRGGSVPRSDARLHTQLSVRWVSDLQFARASSVHPRCFPLRVLTVTKYFTHAGRPAKRISALPRSTSCCPGRGRPVALLLNFLFVLR